MHSPIWFTAALICLPGCGTVFNLTSPPPPGHPGIGPTTCFPFGGVTRSFLLGGFGTVAGVGGALQGEEIGKGGLLAAAGTTALGIFGLAIDTPLSLAGDVVTLPVAIARNQGWSWAIWWGEQPGKSPFNFEPDPNEAQATNPEEAPPPSPPEPLRSESDFATNR